MMQGREVRIENSRNRKCDDVTGAPHYCDFNALHGMLVIFNKSAGTYTLQTFRTGFAH
jgi:hypothetical protein